MNPRDVQRALANTRQQPRNRAPKVRQAMRNGQSKPTPEYMRALERLYRGGPA